MKEIENYIIESTYPFTSSDGWEINRRIGMVVHNLFNINGLVGNVVEIGAGVGHTTKHFLKTACSYNKKVIVIDPFEDFDSGVFGGYLYDEFLTNISGIRSNEQECLILYREPSQEKGIKNKLIEHLPIAFAFVDGIQDTVENVLSDLVLMAELDTKVICVDDVNSNNPNRKETVSSAVNKFIKNYPYNMVENINPKAQIREAYLIKE